MTYHKLRIKTLPHTKGKIRLLDEFYVHQENNNLLIIPKAPYPLGLETIRQLAIQY